MMAIKQLGQVSFFKCLMIKLIWLPEIIAINEITKIEPCFLFF